MTTPADHDATSPGAPVTVSEYVTAYREGRTCPSEVAKRLLAALAASEALSPPMRWLIAQDPEDLKAQARASDERWQAGAPCGPLDGVPVAVKDELDQRGYPTTVGTSFLGTQPADKDAVCVARLREAGALLFGKTNMQEIGLGVTGINPHHGAARNPHDPGRVTGGSSSGTAAVVAGGLCPISLGADGGGSVRIPAALCGIVGLKPTFGRLPETGVFPLCWSVAHLGLFASTVEDLALAYRLTAGADAEDRGTWGQPPVPDGLLEGGVKGLRLGWCEAWAAEAEPPLRNACVAAVEALVAKGAVRVPVEVNRRELIAPVQMVTIGVEMAASQYELRRLHRREYGADTRVLLELASSMPAVDYVRAQRLRTIIAAEFERVLSEVDLLLTPMTAITAPPIHADALASGESDDQVLRALTAFSFAPNLTGHPALSVPVGTDASGLPIGLQVIGRHWQEADLLRLAEAVEQQQPTLRPAIQYRPLG